MNKQRALNQYASVNKHTLVEGVNPHKLITLLYDGAIDNLVKAKGCIMRKDFATKGEVMGRAINIIGGLQGFLDMEKGGDVAKNLDALYDYMQRRLFDATRDNDLEIIDEVVRLIKDVREGWEGIRDEAAAMLDGTPQKATS